MERWFSVPFLFFGSIVLQFSLLPLWPAGTMTLSIPLVVLLLISETASLTAIALFSGGMAFFSALFSPIPALVFLGALLIACRIFRLLRQQFVEQGLLTQVFIPVISCASYYAVLLGADSMIGQYQSPQLDRYALSALGTVLVTAALFGVLSFGIAWVTSYMRSPFSLR
ncbi:MAG: hypothetical protein HY460_02150 [Parcubacteria group bacterium]|nr:hypothetical protein [Parcubacteria group bacterium]